ncbi:MAG: OmpA family protein [Bacteroidetes bacterium]|nr:OmpA family protein [Bacteroidota bacterium]
MTRFSLVFKIAFIIMPYSLCARTADTVSVYFKLNEYKPDTKARQLLDSLLYNDIINTQTGILIIGYADYLGNEEDNLGLSQRRSKSIEDYLSTMSIPRKNIKLCIGKGEINRKMEGREGYAPDRRVDIVLSNLPPANTGAVPIARQAAAGKPQDETSKNLKIISKLQVGQSLKLENIYFLMGRHIVTDESLPQLDKLYEVLLENPNLKIQIEGHICCLQHGFDAEDDDTHEARLSVNRARYIYEYLVKKGIDEGRLRYVGFGRTRPLVSPEKTPSDEDMNRRVEIRVIAK